VAQAPSFDFIPVTPKEQGGLSADEVRRLALAHSPGVQQAQAEREHAERRADRADYLYVPRLDLSAEYMRLSDVTIPPAVRDIFPVILNQYAFRAALTIPVSDYFLTLRHNYKSAQSLESVSQFQLEGQRQTEAFEAVRDYYQWAGAIAAERLLEERVTQLRQFEKEIEVLAKGGELGLVEFAQARARTAGAEAEWQRAKADAKIRESALRRRIGKPDGEPLGVATPVLSQPPPDAPEGSLANLQSRALSSRAEAKALRTLVTARREMRDAAGGGRYPRLDLIGNLEYSNPNQRYLPPSETFHATWAAGVRLSWSPTHLSVQSQEVDDAELEVTRVQQDLRTLEDRIAVEVAQAYSTVISSKAALGSSALAVAAAEENLRTRTAQFRAGATTPRAVFDAEVELRLAQMGWVNDSLNVQIAQAALEQAIGAVPGS
jgi:outer membrane protein TolC